MIALWGAVSPYRLGLFGVFTLSGLAVFTVPSFLTGFPETAYVTSVAIFLLVLALQSRGKQDGQRYFSILFALFTASLAYALSIIVVGETFPASIDGIVFEKLLGTVLVVIPILALTRISGDGMRSIYVRRGRLKPGIAVGSAAFLFFLVTSIQVSTFLFGGRNLTVERLFSWAPWIMTFVLSNGLREELLFRGIFLDKYEHLVGLRSSNFLQAVVFSLAHLGAAYTPFLPTFLLITFFLGLAFGAVIRRTNSLLGATLFHAGTDIPVVLGYFSNIQ